MLTLLISLFYIASMYFMHHPTHITTSLKILEYILISITTLSIVYHKIRCPEGLLPAYITLFAIVLFIIFGV